MFSDVSANWHDSADYTANMSGLLRTMNWFRSLEVHVQSRSDICNYRYDAMQYCKWGPSRMTPHARGQ